MVLVRIDENAGTTSDMLTETGLHWEVPIPADRLPPGRRMLRVLLRADGTPPTASTAHGWAAYRPLSPRTAV
jgi:hypothetical protein